MKWYEKIDSDWKPWFNHAIHVYKDVLGTLDPSFLNHYKILNESSIRDNYITSMFVFLQQVAALCVENHEAKSRFFTTKRNITPYDFYQYTYLMNNTILIKDENLKKLFSISYSIINSISDRFIVQNPLNFQGNLSNLISEDEIFEVLRTLPSNIVVNIVHQLEVDFSQKQSLKEFIIVNDEESFIEFSIKNKIDYSPIEDICGSLVLMNIMRNIKPCFGLPEDGWNIELSASKDDQLFKYIIDSDPDLTREYNNIVCSGEEERVNKILNTPQDILLDSIWTCIYRTIIITSEFKQLCPKNNLILEWDSILQSNSLFKSVNERFSIIDILDLPRFIIPTLEKFKNKYIADLKIPLSDGIKKGSNVCFNGNKTWDEGDILKLYKLLSEQGILSWDVTTYYSFLYRMSLSYRPNQESTKQFLRPIYWNGEKRELLSMVFHFQEGDSRIWKKCTDFFCNKYGDPFQIPAGAKNSATVPTDRMNNILSISCFKK